jgi:hypothetical protein
MTRASLSLRRITALSVAIALFTGSVASAQTPEAAPPNSAQASTVLLSPSAFAGLVKSSTPIVAARECEKPWPRLLMREQAVSARLARTAPPAAAQPPRRRSLANWQKQVLFWGAVVGSLVILANLPDD